MVVGGDGLWNVHVHVDDVGAAIEEGIEVGRPYRIRITHFLAPDGWPPAGWPAAASAVVSVVAGDGLAALLESAG